MSLQRRLTLFFVLIVIVPLLAAGVIVQRVITGEISRRAVISLRPALDATVALYNKQTTTLERQVRAVIDGDPRLAPLLSRDDTTRLNDHLREKLSRSEEVDFLIALDGDEIAGFAFERPGFVHGFELPDPVEIESTTSEIGRGFARTPEIAVRVGDRLSKSSIIGGFWLDDELLLAASRSDVHLSVVADDEVIATTTPLVTTKTVNVDYNEPFDVDLNEPAKAAATALGQRVGVIASTPSGPITQLSREVLTSMLLLLVLALLGTLALAYLLARLITQPLQELAEGARAIAQGRYGQQISVRSRDEVGQLATAFNDMSARLSQTISDLSSSREQMQRAVRRVGETLRSTHDMRQMLDSILNTASDAVDADAAILWLFTPTREELYPRLLKGVPSTAGMRVRVGEGLVGFAAERGQALMVPAEAAPRPSRNEPAFPVAIAVPLYSEDRMIGVLTAYRPDLDRPFHAQDLDNVMFLTEQGGVAIENVRLHEEAQRLSLTDGLTGVWNRRYFQMQFRQVLATAQRFERPFSLLMLDLDNFKRINDTYGHQRGDAVLVEFTQRVKSNLREVDTFARYGGEEFICLLAETDVQGALITAEKINEAIRVDAFGALENELLTLTVSIGVASYPEHGDSFKELVEAADQALYRAKQRGRDQVCLAEPHLKSA